MFAVLDCQSFNAGAVGAPANAEQVKEVNVSIQPSSRGPSFLRHCSNFMMQYCSR